MESAVAVSGDGYPVQRMVQIAERGKRPRLRNASAVSRALQSNFPASTNALPDSADVMLLMRVDERGVVTHTSVHGNAPDQGFNAPAMAVARVMRFRPARYDGCEIPFWIFVPIHFQAQH